MQWMEFIALDTWRKGRLKLKHRSHISLRAVPIFEPKKASWSRGLVLGFSTTVFDHSTECEKFSMQLFSEFHLLSDGADKLRVSAVFDLNGGVGL